MGAGPELQSLTFAGFRMDPARRRLTGPDGAVIALQPRVFDLLLVFLARPGELLSKQSIMDAVWPDTTVDENNLNQAVSTLRRALGDAHDEPRFIATVPRRGYQLIVPVETAEEPVVDASTPAPAPASAADGREARVTPGAEGLALLGAVAASLAAVVALGFIAAPQSSAPANHPEASIAVLPFTDMSPGGDQGYFADGVAEEILDELAHLDGLRVAGRLSSLAAARQGDDARAIGRALGVAHVLEGGVRKDGDRLRITAQLVSTANGYQLWSETYDRQLDDVFAIQDEIARSVTDALSLQLGVASPADSYGTSSVVAYEHYLRGRAQFAQGGAENLRAALAEFTSSTDADPGYGAAWASMARAADSLAINAPARADVYRALQEEATLRAEDADPDQWETVALRARLLMRQWRWTEAADALKDAARYGRPTPVEEAEIEGSFLMQTGRAHDALPVFEAARDSDPLSFTLAATTAWALDLAGDTEAAFAAYARAELLPHDDTDWAFQQLLRLLRMGDEAAVDELFARYPYQEDGTGAAMKRLSAVWRSREEALAVVRSVKDDPAISGPFRVDAFALFAAHYGDADLALELFHEEYFARRGGATVHLWHPLMSDVRRTDGFKQLVRDLGFVDYWRRTGNWADACRPLGPDDFECS